jgi:hypothetical protein
VAVDRHQVDLSIKKPIYDAAMARMKQLQREERLKHGVRITSLADVGRAAIMRYRRGDGADFEPRIVRSPRGQKPKREPFRFDVATEAYERQKRRITVNGHRVTQVVEEALKRFAATGEIPQPRDEDE